MKAVNRKREIDVGCSFSFAFPLNMVLFNIAALFFDLLFGWHECFGEGYGPTLYCDIELIVINCFFLPFFFFSYIYDSSRKKKKGGHPPFHSHAFVFYTYSWLRRAMVKLKTYKSCQKFFKILST